MSPSIPSENFPATVSSWLTKEEAALAELRSSITDLIEDKNAGDQKLTDDLYLLVWLKHANFQVNRAETMIRESVAWRKENNLEILVKQDLNEKLSKNFRISFDSQTKDGMPVFYGRTNELHKLDKAPFLQYVYQVCAKFEQLVLNFNRRKYNQMCKEAQRPVPLTADLVEGGFAIIDCELFGMSELRYPRVLQMTLEVAKVAMKYFPGLISTVFFINMNRFFGVCFKLIKPILTSPSMKLEAFDCNQNKWKTALLASISEDELSVECGGKKICF